MHSFPGNPSSDFRSLPHMAAFPSDHSLFKALVFHARGRRSEEGRVLFAQGDGPIGLYLVRSGTVQAVIHADDGEIAATFQAGPGAVLGLPALAANRPYSLSALARQGSDIAFLSKDDFDDLLRNEPRLCLEVLRALAAEVHAGHETLASLS
jgi:CRP-like cAMP-binding protein